jgi:hypothetical protein
MDIGLLIGLGGILIGVISSYVFYKRSIRYKVPSWAIRSNNLVRGHSSTLSDLRIIYGDKVVDNLTVSKVLIWNDGRETIDRNDLCTVNPLRIKAEEGVAILDVAVLAGNRAANEFSIALADDGKSAHITFAYLDRRQGAVLQVVHDGTSSSSISIEGDIKGVERIRSRTPSSRWRKMIAWPMLRLIRAGRASPAISFILSVIYATMAAAYWIAPPSSPLISPSPVSRIINAGVLLLGAIALFAMALDMRRSMKMAPAGLEVFYE